MRDEGGVGAGEREDDLGSPAPSVDPRAVVGAATDVWKSFGATQALRGVSLSVLAGEVHGLVGRNGAGKSTLVAALTGLVRPDQGTITLAGAPAPDLADRAGWRRLVACVYQRSMVVPTLTVAENIFLGRPTGRNDSIVRWRVMRREARRLMREWGFDLDVDRLAGTLSVELRQVLEIARAVSIGARFLILDEPTASLESGPIERLFERIRSLRASGVGILYISHHLEEIYDVCDRLTVFRDGERTLEGPVHEIPHDRLVAAMVGDTRRYATHPFRAKDPAAAEIRLTVSHISASATIGRVDDVSFELREGECVGLVGTRGSGAVTIADIVAGIIRPSWGEVRVDGAPIRLGRVDNAIRAGIGYVPEDRHARGFVHSMSVEENVTLTVLARLSRFGIVSKGSRRREARRQIENLDIVSGGLDQAVSELSGGNQQKVVVGRSLAQAPRVLVAVSPTVGVDVASKETLVEAIGRAREGGMSVLLVSDDMDDLRICTRLLVLVRGKITREFRDPPWDQHELVAVAEGFDNATAENVR